VQANQWVRDFLPQARLSGRAERVEELRAPRLTRWAERLLRGRPGDALDGGLYRLFVGFYRRRAERRGWSWPALAPAYQRSRYTIPEGGYARVVPPLFAAHVLRRLGRPLTGPELDRFFPAFAQAPGCYGWEDLFRQEYGDVKA
jgi:hypothetical protein